MLRSRLFPSHIRHGVPRIFLTAPLSSAAVGFHQDQGEQLRRYGKLATSSTTNSDTLSDSRSPHLQHDLFLYRCAPHAGHTSLTTIAAGDLHAVGTVVDHQ